MKVFTRAYLARRSPHALCTFLVSRQKRAHMNMSAREKEAHSATVPVHPRRLRTSSTSSVSGSSAHHSVSFSDDSSRHTTPEKAVNPLSSSGILKKMNGGTKHSEYHLLDKDDDDVTRRQDQRDEVRRTALPTIPASPASFDRSSGLEAALAVGEPSPHFHPAEPKSFTSLNELAQGSIDLDDYGAAAKQANGYSSVNGGVPSSPSRNRSMSAASGPAPRGPAPSRRRRSSVNIDGVVVREKKPKVAQGHYTKQPIWIMGLICVILGSLLDFTALAFVDQAVVAPLGSLTLVSNVFFAPLLLKEKVNRKQLYCTFLIVAGSCLAVAFAPHESTSPDIQAMFDNFARPRFIIYAIVSVLSVCGLRVACWKFNKTRRHDSRSAYAKVARYHTFAYAACAGIMGAQSVLFAKCTAMLLAASIGGQGLMFVYWGTYFVLLGLGVTIFLQIRWLNSGLRMFSALLIVPIFQSFWILVSVIAGMIFFGEYEGVFTQTANAILFPFGLGLTICGVYFLTQIKAPASDEAHPIAHRRRSRSSVRASSLSGVAGLVPTSSHAHGLLPTSTEEQPTTSGVPTTPLMKSVSNGDHYGVPQSPRDTPPASSALRKNALRPATLASAGTNHADRSVDLGSYSQEETEQHLRRAVEEADVDAGGEQEEDGGSESGSSSESDDGKPDYPDYAVHSMAPLNFPMFLLPRTLMEEPSSPRPYFESNSSGFQDEGAGSIGLGGLPYAHIFRIAPVREEAYDEENPSSPAPDSVINSPVSAKEKKRGVNGDVQAVMSPGGGAMHEEEWTVPAAAASPGGGSYGRRSGVSSASSVSSAFSPALLASPAFSPAYASHAPSHSPERGGIDLSAISHDQDSFATNDLDTSANGDGLLPSASNVSEYAEAGQEKRKKKKAKKKVTISGHKAGESPLQESLL
jgi:drug/metabolite transporter (DMT)-like permease